MSPPAAAPTPKPTPVSPVNDYVNSQMPNGTYVPGVSSDTGNTDYSGFVNATVGAPPGSSTPNAPVYGAGGDGAQSDPGYASANSAEQLGIPSINNDLNNMIAKRIVDYGDPSLAGMAGFGLDPQAAAFARQNYLSGNGQLARIDKAHENVRRAIINALAAHGLIDSGDTGYQTGQADQTYGNNVYDAQQQALADILGYRNQAQQQRDSLHSAKVAALEQAYTYAMNNPSQYATTTPQTQTPVVSTQTQKALATKPIRTVVKALENPYTTGRKARG
jgi:hypothetical protein